MNTCLTPSIATPTQFCSHCGVSIRMGARFCGHCGTQVPESPSGQSTPPPPPPPLPSPAPSPVREEKAPPVISDPGAAAELNRQGDRGAACLGCVVFGLLVACLAPFPIGPRLVVLVVYLLLALGIHLNSRVAAVVALVFASSNFLSAIAMAVAGGSGPAAAAAVTPVLLGTGVWIKFLYLTVRGTFAWHRHRRLTATA